MALEDLNPAVRVEEILDGADIEPATRLEYFMKKAANEVPKPAGSSDAGKAVLVNEEGDGYELGEIPSGLPEYTSADKGKVLTIGEGEGETIIIVPEQTVTTNENGSADVPNAGLFSSLSVGDNCILIVNGDSYPVTVAYDDEEGFLYVRTMHGISVYTFAYSEEETRFSAINDGYPVGTTDFVISIVQSVTTVEPKWEAVEGGVPNVDIEQTAGGITLLTPFADLQEYVDKYGSVNLRAIVNGVVVSVLSASLRATPDKSTIYVDAMKGMGIFTNPDSIRIQYMEFSFTSSTAQIIGQATATIDATVMS